MPLSEREELELLELEERDAASGKSNARGKPKEPFFSAGGVTIGKNPLDVDWLGATKEEFTKQPPPGSMVADNPLLAASTVASAVPAAAGLVGKGATNLAERFATSPLPKKIADATNVTGHAKGIAGKLLDMASVGGNNMSPVAKKVIDSISGLEGRKLAYSNPYTAIPQGISDASRLAEKSQPVVAKILDRTSQLASKYGSDAGSFAGQSAGVAATVPFVMKQGELLSPKSEAKGAMVTADNLPNISHKLGRYAPLLEKAAQRGGQSAVATTHFLLSQDDPQYQKLMKDIQDQEH